MHYGIPKILEENKQAILNEWRDDLKEKFGGLKEDSRIWLAHELEELFDGIAEKLVSGDISASDSAARQKELVPELFDSLEFASKIECLVSGMRCMVNFVGSLCRKSPDISEEQTGLIMDNLEASLRLQLHDEVETFCKRRACKTLDTGSDESDNKKDDLTLEEGA